MSRIWTRELARSTFNDTCYLGDHHLARIQRSRWGHVVSIWETTGHPEDGGPRRRLGFWTAGTRGALHATAERLHELLDAADFEDILDNLDEGNTPHG